MKKHHDWLPSSQEALRDQSFEVKTFLEKRLEEFGIDPKWFKNDFIPAWEGHNKAVEAWIVPSSRTPIIIEALKDAKAKFVPVYRKLYAYVKANPNITNTDLVSMGFPSRSHDKATSAPVPETYPVLELAPKGFRRVRVTFHDSEMTNLAKPHGVGGAVVRWAILPAPPKDVSELTNSALDTKTPFIISFKESERGTTVYVAAAWQNTRGEKGEWSAIMSTIVP